MNEPDAPALRVLELGEGAPLVVLHGFAMQPRTYLPLARLLAGRARVLIPDLFDLPGPWSFERVLAGLEAAFDGRGLERVSLLGHSFGGGLELGFAARHPERVVECVFSDTLAVQARLGLAAEALRRPWGVLRMATPPAVEAFAESWVTHPWQLVRAGLWAFSSDRQSDIRVVVAAGIPCHVLWANRDSLLRRSDGADFARDLHASFTVARDPTVDHDWMFDDPELFAEHLDALDLQALAPPAADTRRAVSSRRRVRPAAAASSSRGRSRR